MRTLVYIDGPQVPDVLKEWASGQEGSIEWRNGRLFDSPERQVDRVVTDLSGVRDAYESQDVKVVDMPRKNEASGRRYVAEDAGRWKKVKDRQTGEYVEGASKRSMDEAKQVADKLNNG